MEQLASSLGAKHRFSTAYVLWSNGTVEYVCKEALRVMYAFITYFRIPDNYTSHLLGNLAPITVHANIDRGSPITVELSYYTAMDVSYIDQVSFMQKIASDKLIESLDKMNKEFRLALGYNN